MDLTIFHKISGSSEYFCTIFRGNVYGQCDLFVIASLDQALLKYPNYLFSVCIGGDRGGGRFVSSVMHGK